MRITRRIAAPALALLVSLGASGCAGLTLSHGCGMSTQDPMADGASRMNNGYRQHHALGQLQAYQKKALSAGTRYDRGVRKPGEAAVHAPQPGVCY